MFKLRCKRHYRYLATYSWCTTWCEHVTKTAPARRWHSVGGGGGGAPISYDRRRRRQQIVGGGGAAAAAHSSITNTHANFDYPMVIDYYVENYWIGSHFRYREQSVRVKRLSPRDKNCPNFWNPWLKFTYSFTLSLSGRYDEDYAMLLAKIAFSHCEGYKIHCACAVSRDLCIVGPPKPHITIFDPELSTDYTTVMGLRWRLCIVYTWAPPPHVKQFSAAKKCPVKMGPQNGDCMQIERSKYNILSPGPSKRHFFPGTTSFVVFFIKIGPGM